MSIALLLGARPQQSSGGPIVRLLRGTYNLLVHGHSDSRMVVNVDGLEYALSVPMEIESTSEMSVKVDFVERGTEDSISIFAERVE
jgi:hypothetical protein